MDDREWSVIMHKDGWGNAVYSVIRADYVRDHDVASPGPHTNAEACQMREELQKVSDVMNR
jgi:hypothetical protein